MCDQDETNAQSCHFKQLIVNVGHGRSQLKYVLNQSCQRHNKWFANEVNVLRTQIQAFLPSSFSHTHNDMFGGVMEFLDLL